MIISLLCFQPRFYFTRVFLRCNIDIVTGMSSKFRPFKKIFKWHLNLESSFLLGNNCFSTNNFQVDKVLQDFTMQLNVNTMIKNPAGTAFKFLFSIYGIACNNKVFSSFLVSYLLFFQVKVLRKITNLRNRTKNFFVH